MIVWPALVNFIDIKWFRVIFNPVMTICLVYIFRKGYIKFYEDKKYPPHTVWLSADGRSLNFRFRNRHRPCLRILCISITAPDGSSFLGVDPYGETIHLEKNKYHDIALSSFKILENMKKDKFDFNIFHTSSIRAWFEACEYWFTDGDGVKEKIVFVK